MTIHVYFDGEPFVIAHICEYHRELGARYYPCSDAGPDGDCPHVQHAPCDCRTPVACAACPDGVEMVA